MAQPRHRHCSFAVLNKNGKCIAPCHRTRTIRVFARTISLDCIGNSGNTFDYTNGHEVKLMRASKLEV